jgi:hypothetical protein
MAQDYIIRNKEERIEINISRKTFDFIVEKLIEQGFQFWACIRKYSDIGQLLGRSGIKNNKEFGEVLGMIYNFKEVMAFEYKFPALSLSSSYEDFRVYAFDPKLRHPGSFCLGLEDSFFCSSLCVYKCRNVSISFLMLSRLMYLEENDRFYCKHSEKSILKSDEFISRSVFYINESNSKEDPRYSIILFEYVNDSKMVGRIAGVATNSDIESYEKMTKWFLNFEDLS